MYQGSWLGGRGKPVFVPLGHAGAASAGSTDTNKGQNRISGGFPKEINALVWVAVSVGGDHRGETRVKGCCAFFI